MKRKGVQLLTIASLFCCLGVVVLWGRSYWIADGVSRVSEASMIMLTSNRGRLLMHRMEIDGPYASGSGLGWSYECVPSLEKTLDLPIDPQSAGKRWDLHWGGFISRAQTPGSNVIGATHTFWMGYWELGMPHYAVVLFTAIAAMSGRQWLKFDQRRTRRLNGLCVQCGYDVRASPDRCPECGIDIA